MAKNIEDNLNAEEIRNEIRIVLREAESFTTGPEKRIENYGEALDYHHLAMSFYALNTTAIDLKYHKANIEQDNKIRIEDNLKNAEEMRGKANRLVKEAKKFPIDSEKRIKNYREAFDYHLSADSYLLNATVINLTK